MIEVEYKYAVGSLETLQADLKRMNARFVEKVHQEDLYFNHALDNFKEKDIAFRVRKCCRDSNSVAWITYKGPNQDAIGKIRDEHEVQLWDVESADTLQKILAGVGFQPVAPVRKLRERYHLIVSDTRVELCLDEVEGLGVFVEIEMLAEQQTQVERAKETIENLSEQLGLSEPIRTSYLDLLLALG